MSAQTLSTPIVANEEKLRFLASAAAHGGVQPEVIETHMSWVFAAGDRVLKLKKPVRTAFLDFSTLAARGFNCSEEVRLNRRLALGVYLGVAPLVCTPSGTLVMGTTTAIPPGETVDWLVVMRRLPAAGFLDARLRAGMVSPDGIDRLGERLARFFAGARRIDISATAYRQRFDLLQAANRSVLLRPEFADLQAASLLDAADNVRLCRAAELAERAEHGHLREGHGDLRPEHVALDGTPVVIDCLEFNATLREVDPFDELAFLGLECRMLGAAWIEPRLTAHVARALGDQPAPGVQSLYGALRALLRAQLSAAHLLDREPRTRERWLPQAASYLAEARALLAGAASES